MKTEIPLYQLANDLKTLYLKTGDSVIEDLFIQTAQLNESEFLSWLEQNSDIQGKLGNPTVYNALLALQDIRTHVPNSNAGGIVTYLHNKSYLGYVPTFLAFTQLLGSDVGEILSPFASILTNLAPFSGSASDDVNAVKSDLGIVLQSYGDSIDTYEDHIPPVRQKMSRKERRVFLFRYLLTRFSNEMAQGLANIGQEELSSGVKGGLLMRPNDLAQTIGGGIARVRIQLAANIYKEYLKPAAAVDNDFDLTYDNLINAIMINSSMITKTELNRVRNDRMKEIDWSGMIGGGEAHGDPFLKPLEIEYDDKVWFNNNVILITSLILSEFLVQINK